MKNRHVWLCVGMIIGSIALSNRVADAQEDAHAAVMGRLDRLERQVQQLAEPRGPANPRPEFAPVNRPGLPGAMGGMNQPAVCPLGPAGARCVLGIIRTMVLVLVVIHVLLATWVFTDIRKRGEGSGLFIVLALLAGIPGTILYALVRIGDRKPNTT